MSHRHCCVCKASEHPWDKSRLFHKFPKNENLKEKWLAAIGRKCVAKTSNICSDHFSDSSYRPNEGYPSSRRLLRADAVPELIEPNPSESSSLEQSTCKDIQVSELQLTNVIDKNQQLLPSEQSSRPSGQNEEQPQARTTKNNIIYSERDVSQCTLEGVCIEVNRQHITEKFRSEHSVSEKSQCQPSTIQIPSNNESTAENGHTKAHELLLSEDVQQSTSELNATDPSSLMNESIDQTPQSECRSEPVSGVTDHACIQEEKRRSLKRKSESPVVENCPTKIRFKNGCKTVEVSEKQFTSQKAFRDILILLKIKNRQITALRRKVKRSNEKISILKAIVEKLESEKEFAAANYLKVSPIHCTREQRNQ